MKNKEELIHIFFATTDNYVKYMDVAITSLIENADKDYNYKIVVLHNGISKENEKILKEHNDENFTVELADVEKELAGIKEILPNKLHFTLASYYRLFIEKMYPNIDKAIYLDCDIVVPGDISKLYFTDIGDNLLGAINEQNCFLIPIMTTYIIEVTGIDPHKYFNSGVLLLNLKEIRKFKLLDTFVSMMIKYNFESPMVDQDYLNNICRKRVKLLPNGWNKESVPGQELEGELYIKHYAFGNKPWKTDQVEYFDLFWDYAKKSKFYDEILAGYKAITPKDLEMEKVGIGKMMEIVDRLLKSDYTFKKVIIDKEDAKATSAKGKDNKKVIVLTKNRRLCIKNKNKKVA